MEKTAMAFVAAIGVAVLFVILIPLGAVIGAFAGWVVSGIFPEMMQRLADILGVTASYQAGAMLGFVGSFFRAVVSK